MRKHRLEKVARKRAEKARKLEAKERHKQEKRRLADAKARLEEQSKADAEMGGGIVNVQGVQIKTKVNKHPTYLLRDLLGIKSKAEKSGFDGRGTDEAGGRTSGASGKGQSGCLSAVDPEEGCV